MSRVLITCGFVATVWVASARIDPDLLNSTAVFIMTGTVPNTIGTFAAVSAATGHLAIDTLLISIDNPATPSCPSCVNPVGIDNIAVSF